MSYIYTQENRLVSPHKYMYTGFQGNSFFNFYLQDRKAMLERTERVSVPVDISDLLPLESNILRQIRNGKLRNEEKDIAECQIFGFAEIDSFLSENIETASFFEELLRKEIEMTDYATTKKWLDLAVQRFEVTKKLYTNYQAGFRKGHGNSDSVLLYWLFSIALCLFYLKHKQLKYLNTWLKVNDLLISLSDYQLFGCINKMVMTAVIEAEIACVEELINKTTI